MAVLFFSLLAGCGQLPSLAPEGKVKSAELTELSGIVAAGPGQYWAINDSGNPPELFRFNDAGEVQEKVRLENARNIDWEAMTRDSTGNMYVCDVGDNKRQRGTYMIYRVSGGERPKVEAAFQFRYGDGSSRNCEAVFAFKDSLYLITKEDLGQKAVVFKLDLSAPPGDPVRSAAKVAVLSIANPVTDVAYSPERKEIAILTYLGATIFHFEKEEDFKSLSPVEQIVGFFGQCEAITYTTDGAILITNEPGDMWRRRLSEAPPVVGAGASEAHKGSGGP